MHPAWHYTYQCSCGQLYLWRIIGLEVHHKSGCIHELMSMKPSQTEEECTAADSSVGNPRSITIVQRATGHLWAQVIVWWWLGQIGIRIRARPGVVPVRSIVPSLGPGLVLRCPLLARMSGRQGHINPWLGLWPFRYFGILMFMTIDWGHHTITFTLLSVFFYLFYLSPPFLMLHIFHHYF